MGLEISKTLLQQFHPMSLKVHEDIDCHGGIHAVIFLGNQPSLKKFVALFYFFFFKMLDFLDFDEFCYCFR